MAYQLAQINIGRLVAPIDDPKIAEFVAQLDPINALADQARGLFGGSSRDRATPRTLRTVTILRDCNMSVWESVEALREFAYKSVT